jgi:hypothetical protein
MLIFSIPVSSATGFGASAQEMAILEEKLQATFVAVQAGAFEPATTGVHPADAQDAVPLPTTQTGFR